MDSVLLLEHLIHVRYRGSVQGVLFIITVRGDAFFYPLSEQTKGNTPGGNPAKLLTTDSAPPKKLRPTDSSSATTENNKYFAYDSPLAFNADLYKVFTFNFLIGENNSFLPPKKILLSPNKKLLLLHGALYKNISCLLVYQILEQGIEDFYFKLIFYDLSLTFIDVCFSPDSNNLVVIPSRFPAFIFMLSLPIITIKPKKNTPGTSEVIQRQKFINYEARRAGPVCIMGPGKGVFGQPLLMTHISSNIYSPNTMDENYFHFVTWNDDGMGEYCLWRYSSSPSFYYSSRTLDQGQDVAKNYILDIQFPPSPSISKLFFVVKRENYSKKGDNGVGLQMIKIVSESIENIDSYWYQVTEMLEPKITAKWTNTLLLGSISAASVLVKGKGLFELVDGKFGSAFQALYDVFINEACNFVQVGRYHRFWVTNSGALRVIVVTPQSPSMHPEWNELFTRSDILSMRMLGRRIGYFINEIEKDSNVSENLPTKKGPKKTSSNESNLTIGEGTMDRFSGLHLYRCVSCKRVLLKPLQCSRCKTVVYCSKVCQKTDWQSHSVSCINTTHS